MAQNKWSEALLRKTEVNSKSAAIFGIKKGKVASRWKIQENIKQA